MSDFARSLLQSVLTVFFAFLLIIVACADSSQAIALPITSPTEQTATLAGPKADAPIPLYLRPAANQPSVGYGANGDVVTILEQIASFLPEADQSSSWNHIRLEVPPYTEGWVQGKFLVQTEDTRLENGTQ